MTEMPRTMLDIDIRFKVLAQRIDATVESSLRLSLSSLALDETVNVGEFTNILYSAIQGGKRLRALCSLVGAACLSNSPLRTPANLLDEAWSRFGTDRLAAAIELYQTSALIHDDVVDRAEERRGLPAFHAALTKSHSGLSWQGDSAHFGLSSAILGGDLLLSAADSLVASSSQNPSIANRLLVRFTKMGAEVAFGQYLDLRATQLTLGDIDNTVANALAVVRLKSARYSVVHPVVLGAIHQGANAEMIETLESIFEPVGIAFQLRDDYLGIFGTPSLTGKPTGSDIIEGKRTVLLALTMQAVPLETRREIEEIYGSSMPPSEHEIAAITEKMTQYGLEEHERLISSMRDQSQNRLAAAPLNFGAKELCRNLIERLTARQF